MSKRLKAKAFSLSPLADFRGVILWVALALLACVALSSCASLSVNPEPLVPNVYYQHDMIITVNGVKCKGTCAVSRADKYEIKIESKEDVDQLLISTCKRTEAIPAPKELQGGWFKKRRGYTYLYQPSMIEREAGCRMEIAGFEKKRGQHSWALLVFEHPAFKLKAGIACNSSADVGALGVGVCEAMQGQLMMIWFEKPVRIGEKVIKEKCTIPISTDGVTWKFPIPRRECVYVFESISKPYEQFQLTTSGAEEIPIREE